MWHSNDGHHILKYNFAGRPYYLLYPPGQPLEGGDYKTLKTLKEAKRAAEC